jgi:serine O-acetyltransferase
LDFPKDKLTFTTLINQVIYNNRFRLILNYRVGNYLIKSKILKLHLFADYLKYKQLKKYNCQIGYYATIGKNLQLPHPLGIVIGQGVVIADDVAIFQNVTIGTHGKSNAEQEYPRIEEGVIIYSGSVIVGGVTIGANSIIGANSFVNKDILPNSVYAGQPAKIIKNNIT